MVTMHEDVHIALVAQSPAAWQKGMSQCELELHLPAVARMHNVDVGCPCTCVEIWTPHERKADF